MNPPVQDITEEKERLLGQSALVEGLSLVLGLAAAILSNSLSLYADLLQESAETMAAVVAWAALRRLRRNHHVFDFGGGKVESLLGMFIAASMCVSIYCITKAALFRLAVPQPLEQIGLGLILVIAWICVNTYYWQKFLALDRRQPSPVAEATWKAFRAGTVACVGLSATLLAGKLLEKYHWALYIDPVVSLVYTAYTLRAVYEITASALGDLSDHTLEETLQLVIVRELARFFNDYEQVYAVKSRRSGGAIHIELHLGFNPDWRLSEVFEVSQRIKTRLEAEIRGSKVIIVPTRAGSVS